MNILFQDNPVLAIGNNYTIGVQLWSFEKTSEFVTWWHYIFPDVNDPGITYDYDANKVTFSWADASFKDMQLVVWSSAFNASSRRSFSSSDSVDTFDVTLEEFTWYWCIWFPLVHPQVGYPKLHWLYLKPKEVPLSVSTMGALVSVCDGYVPANNDSTYIYGYEQRIIQVRFGPTDTVSYKQFIKSCL